MSANLRQISDLDSVHYFEPHQRQVGVAEHARRAPNEPPSARAGWALPARGGWNPPADLLPQLGLGPEPKRFLFGLRPNVFFSFNGSVNRAGPGTGLKPVGTIGVGVGTSTLHHPPGLGLGGTGSPCRGQVARPPWGYRVPFWTPTTTGSSLLATSSAGKSNGSGIRRSRVRFPRRIPGRQPRPFVRPRGAASSPSRSSPWPTTLVVVGPMGTTARRSLVGRCSPALGSLVDPRHARSWPTGRVSRPCRQPMTSTGLQSSARAPVIRLAHAAPRRLFL